MRYHYSDPTADAAIAHVDRELRMQRKREEQRERAAAARIAAANEKDEIAEKPAEQPQKEEAQKQPGEGLCKVWSVPQDRQGKAA